MQCHLCLLAAASLLSSLASEKLSLDLPAGLSLAANQLNRGDNTLESVLPDVPRGTTVYLFRNSAGRHMSSVKMSSWVPNLAVPPGTPFVIDLDRPQTITFEGTPSTNNLWQLLYKGFNLVAAKQFKGGRLDDLYFPGAEGAQVYFWKAERTNFFTDSFLLGSWQTSPAVRLGEAFWALMPQNAYWNEDTRPPGDYQSGDPFPRTPPPTPEFGTVQFANVWPRGSRLVGAEFFPAGLNNSFQAQLWVGNSTNTLAPVQIPGQSPVRFSGFGEFAGGFLHLETVQGGSNAIAQVRIWPHYIASYDEALSDPEAVIFESNPFPITPSQTNPLMPYGQPAYLDGLTEFRVRPIVRWTLVQSEAGMTLRQMLEARAESVGSQSGNTVPGQVEFQDENGQSMPDFPQSTGQVTFTALFKPQQEDRYLQNRQRLSFFVFRRPGLVISDPKLQNGAFSLSVATDSAHQYTLEYSDTLAGPWSSATQIASGGDIVQLADPSPANSIRFYRVRQDEHR